MTESAEHRIETARVRRSPRYAMFLVAGAVLGVVVALVLTFAFGPAGSSPSTQVVYSSAQVFGFLALVCITIGLAVGGGVALVIDRSLSRRAREVRIDHERVEVVDADDDPSTRSATGA